MHSFNEEQLMASPDDAETERGEAQSSAYRTCAVIVSYYPNVVSLGRLLDSLLSQVRWVVVVDNGSPQDILALLALRGHASERFLPLGENLGVAAAQNRGIAWARSFGADAVVLFDQDSLPAPDMIAQLRSAFFNLEADGHRVGAIGPRPTDMRLSRGRGTDVRAKSKIALVDHLIASGSFIPIPTLDTVGAMREDLFIDYVDIEWCLRAASHNFSCYRMDGVLMPHEFGVPIGVLGRNFATHSPMRHYYLFRNSIWMLAQRAIPWRWRLRQAPRLILRLCFNLLFARPHRQQWRMMIRGIADGFTGRMGKGHEEV